MGWLSILNVRQGRREKNKLEDGLAYIYNEIASVVDKDSVESGNFHEFAVFCISLTMSLYTAFRDKSVDEKCSMTASALFLGSATKKMARLFYDEGYSTDEIKSKEDFDRLFTELIVKREKQYGDLLFRGLNKPRGVVALSEFTIEVLKNIYGVDKSDDLYDPTFAMKVIEIVSLSPSMFGR